MSDKKEPEIFAKKSYNLVYDLKKRKYFYSVMITRYIGDVPVDEGSQYLKSQYFDTEEEAYDAKISRRLTVN